MEDNYQSEFVKDRRSRLRRHMLYVMGECCQICGYNRCSGALEFHHLEPTTKERNLSKNWPYSWERSKEELKKCILLCSNCHREVHLGIIDQSKLNREHTIIAIDADRKLGKELLIIVKNAQK